MEKGKNLSKMIASVRHVGKVISRLIEPIRYAFSHVPVVGPLVYCKWKDHKASFREMTIILLFATATFWLTSLILMGFASTRALGYVSVLFSTVKSGELFIFSVGFIGPILLSTAEDKKDEREFPGRLWHLLALVLLALVGTAFHSQIKSAQLTGSVNPADFDFWVNASLYIAASAVILRYLSMVYRKSTFSPQKEIKSREENFADEYAKHRGEDISRITATATPSQAGEAP